MTKAATSVAHQLEARGWLEGREEGRREGREEARTALADILRHQLKHRFGVVPDRLEARIAEADMELIAQWSKRAVDATCLDNVFADSVDMDVLEKTLNEMAERLAARGARKGRQEGLQEARTALADVLRHQLEHKFGKVPDHLQAKIAAAEVYCLARWLKQVLDATRPEDAFLD